MVEHYVRHFSYGLENAVGKATRALMMELTGPLKWCVSIHMAALSWMSHALYAALKAHEKAIIGTGPCHCRYVSCVERRFSSSYCLAL